jgi:hypothetical protein
MRIDRDRSKVRKGYKKTLVRREWHPTRCHTGTVWQPQSSVICFCIHRISKRCHR